MKTAAETKQETEEFIQSAEDAQFEFRSRRRERRVDRDFEHSLSEKEQGLKGSEKR
jgi:hypothetical protein